MLPVLDVFKHQLHLKPGTSKAPNAAAGHMSNGALILDVPPPPFHNRKSAVKVLRALVERSCSARLHAIRSSRARRLHERKMIPAILISALLSCALALPVQFQPGANISTDVSSLFTPGAGQEWGPDVSHYQGNIDWAAVKRAGASFAFAKATEGLSFVDASFAANAKGMRAEGFSPRGYYHFGHPNESAATQAAHFCHTVGALQADEVAVLDIESATNADPAQVAKWSKDFVDAVMSTLGLPASRVYVYTGAWFWNPQAGGSSALSAHPLWVSGYTKEPPMPKGWATWTFWQYTDKATIAGIKGGVDCSVKK